LAVFRQMADMSNDAFYLCDEHGRFLYVNERASSFNGYSRDELLTMSVSDINPDFPPERLAEFVSSLKLGSVAPFETITRWKDGTTTPIELSVAGIELDGVAYMFGVVRDISERKQLETARKSFTQRMLQTLEAERQRVARELHDDVGQAVATVGVLLHTLAQPPGAVAEAMRPALHTTLTTIGEITESVARLCREYHPAELLGLGLEGTLAAYVREFARRHGVACRLSIALTEPLGAEHELHLYRIVQETFTNIARHAQARQVTMRLACRGQAIVLTIHDDGVGFTPDSTETRGLGLVTIRERAEIMGATLTIRSRPRRGTEVRVVLPLAATRAASDVAAM
jgi:PAS domain S-box-containing protein